MSPLYSEISGSFFDRFGNFGVEKKAKKGTRLSINDGIAFLLIAITITIMLAMILG